jgi:hypothetical protein
MFGGKFSLLSLLLNLLETNKDILALDFVSLEVLGFKLYAPFTFVHFPF